MFVWAWGDVDADIGVGLRQAWEEAGGEEGAGEG